MDNRHVSRPACGGQGADIAQDVLFLNEPGHGPASQVPAKFPVFMHNIVLAVHDQNGGFLFWQREFTHTTLLLFVLYSVPGALTFTSYP